MIQLVYYILYVLAGLVSLASWRTGVIACMIFDAIRNPFRKVTPDYPIAITISVAGLWLATFIGACQSEPERLRLARRFYPQTRRVGWSIVLALIPARSSASSVIRMAGYWRQSAGYRTCFRSSAWR